MKIKPQPGDYVVITDLKDEVYYDVVRKLFNAGFEPNHAIHRLRTKFKYLFITHDNRLILTDTDFSFVRKLPIDDLLDNDEYKPVVGVECEYKHKNLNQWQKTTPLFIGKQIMVIKDWEGDEISHCVESYEFREFKSERQKFIDEHRDEIEKLVLGTMVKDTAGALFDAGFKKP